MEASKQRALEILSSLFDEATYVSFARMEEASGLTRDEVVELKQDLEELLRGDDRSITLTSVGSVEDGGFFLDVP